MALTILDRALQLADDVISAGDAPEDPTVLEGLQLRRDALVRTFNSRYPLPAR